MTFRPKTAIFAVVTILGCSRANDTPPRPATDSAVVVANTAVPVAGDAAVVIPADSSVVSAIHSALDSCSRDSNTAARWSGSLRSFGSFALFIPDSVRILGFDRNRNLLALGWPRCPEACGFNVAVYGDSGVSLAARIARRVADQRRIDSVNSLPGGPTEFNDMDAPPRSFSTKAGPGYAITESCGDCAATTLEFSRAGLIADVSLTADAKPGAGQRMCEMAAVGMTFSWRP